MVVIPQQSLKLPKKKIDLTQVTGTGRDGRITRKDVTNFTPTQARTPEKTASPGTSPSISEEPVASQNESAATASPTETTTDKIVSADPVRKAIAKNGPKCQRNPSRLVNGGSGCDQLSPT